MKEGTSGVKEATAGVKERISGVKIVIASLTAENAAQAGEAIPRDKEQVIKSLFSSFKQEIATGCFPTFFTHAPAFAEACLR